MSSFLPILTPITAADVATAVWASGARTLTASLDPNAATIAAQVRTNLTTELARIDASISTRLAAVNYVAPDNTKISELHAKNGLVIGTPVTITPTAITAGAISLTLSGDGTTSTTVTRNA